MALYDDAVKLAKEYIGPAGQTFIDRQLSSHLNLTPADLTVANLLELAKWCHTSGRMLIDEAQAVEFSNKVKALK